MRVCHLATKRGNVSRDSRSAHVLEIEPEMTDVAFQHAAARSDRSRFARVYRVGATDAARAEDSNDGR
jgi:hypothetical protein